MMNKTGKAIVLCAMLLLCGRSRTAYAGEIIAGLGAEYTAEEITETATENASENPADGIVITFTESTENKEEEETAGMTNPAGETAVEEVTETVSEAAGEAVTESVSEGIEEPETEPDMGPLTEIIGQYLEDAEGTGEKWAVSIQDLTTDKVYEYHADLQMQSASVIKVFIMGAVYDRICYPENENRKIYYTEGYDGELRNLLENMIRVSDNDAANRLVEILGLGDFEAGKRVVNEFCEEHGFEKTHLGRRFLASNPTDDNMTSSGDCRRFLEAIYKGTLVSTEASEKMLGILQGQTVQYKIPAVLPEGYFCANKTGEMPEGYGLGCIENDIAIVYSPTGNYILAILSGELAGRNQAAQETIQHISADTAAWFVNQSEM